MGGVSGVDRSRQPQPAVGTGPTAAEKKRAELQKQLAALGNGWSSETARKRDSLKRQLATLEPKSRPPPGPRAPATPQVPQAPTGGQLPPSLAARMGIKQLPPERMAPPKGPPLRDSMLLGQEFHDAAITKDVQNVPSGLVSPEKGKAYTTSVEWNGERHEIRATFDEKTIAQLKATGSQIDIANGERVAKDGKRTSLLPSVAQAYTSETGGAAPRSVVRLGDADLSTEGAPDQALTSYVLPTNIHYLSDEKGMGASVLQYDAQYDTLKIPADVVEPNSIHKGDEIAPLAEPPGGFVKKQLAPGVTVEGVSEEAIAKAMPSINEILGKRLNDPSMFTSAEDLKKLQELKQALLPAGAAAMAEKQGMRVPPQIASQVPSPERVQELIAQAKALAAPKDASAWNAFDAYAAVSSREAEAAQQQAETRLIVVPEGKHWTAMPQFKKFANDPHELKSEAVTWRELVKDGDQARLRINLALPQSDKSAGEHEMFHLLDHRFMTPAEHERLDKAYQSAIQNNGAFARMYGAVKPEYWTTWSEQFRGAYGPRGVEFLKTKAPEIYELMAEVTGQRP